MATFLLEVGTEELPAQFVASALQQWRSRIPADLKAHFLEADQIEVFGTPRRLAVLIQGLPDQQPQREEEIKGPPAQAAFKNGQPTPAALGFARKQGVEVSDFELRPTDKGEFVFVRKVTEGRATPEVLSELIPQWIFGLEGKRFMRWAEGDLRFSRPVRWLVSLWNEAVLPLQLENAGTLVKSDRLSWGHRVLHPDPVSIPTAAAYAETLGSAYVQVDPDQRQATILKQVKSAAQSVRGQAEIPGDLLSEVVFLVEWPTAVVGSFAAEFLELPPEVVTTEMVSHQRYFPVRPVGQSSVQDHGLLPYFITISNGDPGKSDVIAAGNERVIRARLSDGQFFFKADQAIALADYLPKLETVTFQADLGSVRAKADRIQQNAQMITQQLTQPLSLDAKTIASIDRAALLCKADLVTQMVGEFPELQGIMGEKYAIASGEPEAVATAIAEHYHPRTAEDSLPQSLPGQVVAISDRLDTLVCIFGLGMLPTGSSDPFALRRAANAVLNIIWSAQLPLNLKQLLQSATARFTQTFHTLTPQRVASKPGASQTGSSPQDTLQIQLQDFFLQRIRTLLQEEHHIDYDLVSAVLGETDPDYTQRALEDLLDLLTRAQFLQQLRADGTLGTLYETINRATRLAKQGSLDTHTLDPAAAIDPAHLQQASEKALYHEIVALLPQTQRASQARDYALLVQELVAIAPRVSDFFDGADSVLVMAEDPNLRQNRLNLLGLLRNHARVLADFGEVVKS
ncbi:MAG: glycine--tRNA ligase subunit beta [Thermosynechococcaceae cyanobacterium MS004]|nr:glycine--tRNA ligase subunit beta [Thermosynechococcaceae cyanobacterium MS004]